MVHYDVFKDVHTNVIAQTYMFYMYVGISGGGGALNAKEITFLHDAEHKMHSSALSRSCLRIYIAFIYTARNFLRAFMVYTPIKYISTFENNF